MVEFLIAFGAGLISFLSPCVLPLIPGYIAFISGSTFNELLENRNFKRIVLADTSKRALLCSVKNIKAFRVKRRCTAVLSKFFSNIPNTRFDVICSNPPYISEKEYALVEKQEDGFYRILGIYACCFAVALPIRVSQIFFTALSPKFSCI